MELVTLDFLKLYLSEAQYNRATTIQARLSDLISDYVNSPLEPTQFTNEIYDSSTSLVLKHMPIISVTSLVDLATDPETILVNGTDYYVYPSSISIPNRVAGKQDLNISYTAGFDSLPAMFFVVAEDLVRYWAFKEERLDELFFKQETMEDRSYQVRDMSELTILSKLAKYRQSSSEARAKKSKVRIGVI